MPESPPKIYVIKNLKQGTTWMISDQAMVKRLLKDNNYQDITPVKAPVLCQTAGVDLDKGVDIKKKPEKSG